MARPGRRILLVEDDADTLRLYALMFQQEGYVTWCTATVAEALRVLRTEKLDVVLTDHALGDGTGSELLEHAFAERLIHPAMLTVMCTADDRVVPPQGVALFHKPIRPTDLHRAIASRLGDTVEELS